MKLNKLFYLLIAVCAIFTACGESTTSEEQPAKGYLTVIDESVALDFIGGKGEIYYVITDGDEGARPSARTTVKWIKNIAMDEMTITFDVEPNTLAESRVATLIVSYGKQSYDVFVRQEAAWIANVEFTATALNGHYRGTMFGDPNYCVILSKNGVTGEMAFGADTYYRLDMVSTIAAGDVVTLPHGVYTFDMYDTGKGDTFGYAYSWFLDVLDTGNYFETRYEDGIIIVGENKIEAWLKLEANGDVHHVLYEGSLDLSYREVPKPDFYSTLTEDLTVNATGGELRLINYGDTDVAGANTWSVSMADPSSNNYPYFMLVVVAETSGNDIDSILGTYTVATDNVAKSTFLAGSKDNNNLFVGSWYFDVVDDYYGTSTSVPLTGGTITIAKDGATGYVVTYDCVDDNGHKVTGTYSCAFATDYTSQQ